MKDLNYYFGSPSTEEYNEAVEDLSDKLYDDYEINHRKQQGEGKRK